MEVGKLAHSHSQPGGMDRTPPGTPKKGGKMLAVRVQMLDDTVTMFQVQAKALGRVLFDQVCNQLNLLEADYFGLEYQEATGTKYWLDLEKPLSRQIGLSLVDTLVRFCVKFYTPDPSQLEEEFTRYLFCLQIKRDLSQGLLLCNSNTAALMASYIVQAECGDYVVEDYPDHRYLSSYKFVPNQDQELERRIMENHKKHAGQSPAEADLNLLETARRCELYGIKMHPAKDHEGCPLNLAVAHMGIVVFQNFSKINTFSWAKIRKISFKRKRFLVKLHPEGYGYYKDTVEFFFEGRNECKNFWKKCVENHGFFRCTMVKKVPRQKTRVLSRGSSFRYSGRTQKQIVDFVRENYVKRQTFQRSQSFRHSSSAHSSVANVGTSISAHPLLPLGDNAVAGTPVSLSCGSMTLTSSPVHTADIHAGASPSPPLTTSVSPGTSVTSSPQHFYPQETRYRRAGHRPAKVKHPPVRSHRAISPLLSPTDAATAASNRSASHSNSNIAVVCSDIISSRSSLKSPEFIDFNDVYSNCYTSLRSLRNVAESKMVDEKKDVFNGTCDFLNSATKSNESIVSLSKKGKPPLKGDDVDVGRYTWHRSASCKELYHQASGTSESIKDKCLTTKALENHYEVRAVSASNRYDTAMRKCYSAVPSKSSLTSESGNGGRAFSHSYPGITRSLSTELAEGELEDPVVDAKYDSHEEIALSHDDVSHDSYELLEKELYDFNEDSSRRKRSKIICDNERTRSCSWGSDRGISPLDFRSFENIIGSGLEYAREQNRWSLERETGLKHKSEMDFRSLNDKSSKDSRQAAYMFEGNSYDDVAERQGRSPGFFDFEEGNREVDSEIFETGTTRNQSDKRIFSSKVFGDSEVGRGVCQDIKSLRGDKEEKENFDDFVKKKYQNRRKSFEELKSSTVSPEFGKEMPLRIEERRRENRRREKREREERFHEGIKEKEQKEWAKEKERRQTDRRRSTEEKELRGAEDSTRKMPAKPNDYANFQEIHFKKFERVVSNQFGKYPEFLTLENTYDFLVQEKKVMENYEKVCQVSRLAKELKKTENCVPGNGVPEKRQENIPKTNKYSNTFGEFPEFAEWKNTVIDFTTSSKVGRAHVERTKSDPFNAVKNQKRNILMHQKSIDLTPQHSEETPSDYDNEEVLRKASRSEHDIPYILHKRHCMNGTARNADILKTDFKTGFSCKTTKTSEREARNFHCGTDYKKPISSDGTKEALALKQKPSCAKVAEAKKAGVEIINLDLTNGKSPVSFAEAKKVIKPLKQATAKKSVTAEIKPVTAKTVGIKREIKNFGRSAEHAPVFAKIKDDAVDAERSSQIWHETFVCSEETEEPIYAEVCAEKTIADDGAGDNFIPEKNFPPDPPKRSSSFASKPCSEEKMVKSEKKTLDKIPFVKKSVSQKVEPPSKMGCPQKAGTLKPSETGEEERSESKTSELKMLYDGNALKTGKMTGGSKSESSSARGKHEASFSSSVHQRREDSLTLFARTRLGLSEGSAFAPMVRQGRVGSPSSQRRTKSLDAPYVSVHSLPPADAFSSKDDTVDGNEGYIVDSAMAKFEEFCKGETQKSTVIKNEDRPTLDPSGNTESEVDSVFTDDLEMEVGFKKTIESQTKIEILGPEDKVLDGVRGKRLLSKIESVDFIDSEGDLDSSKIAGPPAIPSDRLVNLPESIRFPSVRQISGQTSEESADGWEQKEVQVKRRTPRRSVGREEPDTQTKESVVWDSKDDEPPDDDVWDGNLTAAGIIVNPTEYLKRGSCGQSIDDDNLSTPMKESSPEHWVSVDDLPEALEREEKLLRQQEKILREKILNEKLKRELNLDTIDVDERYCDYRDGMKHSRFEEESTSLKENFKGHSLDTYELTEKKMRERGDNKNSSLDEGLLPNKLIDNYGVLDMKEKRLLKPSNYREGLDYIQCKVVKDVAEIDQFGDNDEELEEFFVVLDENLGKEGRNMVWDDDDTFKRTLSIDESLLSVPEEFKDVEKEDEELQMGENALNQGDAEGRVEIRLNEIRGGERRVTNEKLTSNLKGKGELDDEEVERKMSAAEGGNLEGFKPVGSANDAERLSPCGESRRDSEEKRKLSFSEEAGRLSPYDTSSRRNSDDPRRFSGSEDADRLSPYSDSRRESEDPRRLSTSEDSRKCSVSESVSEETRRRLSSTEETRRKRASLTKQCSVGAESLSDEVISGIQECSSSFEHDEKDVFEPEPVNVRNDAVVDLPVSEMMSRRRPLKEKCKEKVLQGRTALQSSQLEVEVLEETSDASENVHLKVDAEKAFSPRGEVTGVIHLAPPASERELSRETEDSVDYGEGDFKDIREVVKEKDISGGFIGDVESARPIAKKLPSSFEKSESSEGEEMRYIDDKRGSTPEILVGKSKEAVAMSIVVVNEGLSILNKINDWHPNSSSEEAAKTQSLSQRAAVATVEDKDILSDGQRHTLPKIITKPKPLTPKPLDYVHRKLTKIVPEIKVKAALIPVADRSNKESINLLKSSLDSSQESDLDKFSDLPLVSHVQNQIAKRNLSDAGKCLRRDELRRDASVTSLEECGLPETQKISSEERDKTESSSFEWKSSADELVGGDCGKWNEAKRRCLRSSGLESKKTKKEGNYAGMKEKRSPEQEKRDSGEDGSSSSSTPLYPKRELSSTWKPFLLESSGSSSLEEGWLPPDENAHLADEEETSSTSNNQQDDSCHDDLDYPTGVGYPALNGELMISGYGSVFALSRTLSRISERSTSEQERSDLEDDMTKPSSRSVSVEEESILSSDHQPSLSSDPPSPKENASVIPDLPVDKPAMSQFLDVTENTNTICEPFGYAFPLPLPEGDWPSPPSSFGIDDTPVVSHVETFYMEIHPEEACKVVVAGAHEEGNSSSDDNQTLQEESEFLHLSSDNMSASTTTTTQDGTVVIPVRPSVGRTGSISEDVSVISTSEWSSPTFAKPRAYVEDDTTEHIKASGLQDRAALPRGVESCQNESTNWSSTPLKYCPESYFGQDSQKSKTAPKVKPLKLSSPSGKTFGFFETPVSKVRSPTSQMKFFDGKERRSSATSSLRSPTSFSETTSPKTYGRFFECHGSQILGKADSGERRTSRSPTKGKHCQYSVGTPYYSNVSDSAEKSYFGRYDTGSLERTKIQYSRKCCSYYSVSKTGPNEGDSSNSDGPLPSIPSPNTIPRASKKTKKRHRVAMDLVVRDGKIVTPPKTKATVVEDSDSDRSSPRQVFRTDTRKKQSDV